MDIKLKEGLYLRSAGIDHIIRSGTSGVESQKVVYFYDVTRTVAAGFSRDFCLENPQIFQVSRNLSDREVSVRDVLKIIDESSLSATQTEELYQKVKAL